MFFAIMPLAAASCKVQPRSQKAIQECKVTNFTPNSETSPAIHRRIKKTGAALC